MERPQRVLRVLVFGAAGTGRSRLVAELAEASSQLVVAEGLAASIPNPEAGAPATSGQAEASPADLILLTGLDLPPSGEVLPAEQARQDAALRHALQSAGFAWRVVYGVGADRIRNALQAVAEVAPWAWQPAVDDAEAGRWQRLQANCEKCGDASCEHRLFSRLAGGSS